MMSSPLVNMLFNVPMVLWTGFYLVAFIVVMLKTTNATSAKSKVLAGLGLQLTATVGGMIIRWILSRYLESEQMMWGHGMISIATSVLNILGLLLIISAVFTEREGNFAGTRPVAGAFDNENPYSTPTQS